MSDESLTTDRSWEDMVRRIAELEAALWLLVGDTKARAVSCNCYPPLTKNEKENIERAEALTANHDLNEMAREAQRLGWE